MKRLYVRIAGLVAAGILTACSSTMPQAATNPRAQMLPTVTPEAASAQPTPRSTAVAVAVPTPTAAPITPTPGEGPITDSMAKLNIDGERYATLGDPNAPVTIVEFSDYG
jgi:protein-disulfide isomerase